MKYPILFILVFLFSCSNKKALLKEKDYEIKLRTFDSDYERSKVYKFSLPTKGKLVSIFPQDGEIYREYRIQYPDGSTFYITNDLLNGSDLNFDYVSKNGVSYHKDKLVEYKVYKGKTNVNKYWKDEFIGSLVIGYTNSSIGMKKRFDKSIELFISNNKIP